MAAAHGISYHLRFPVSEVLLIRSIPVGFTPSDPVTGFQAPKLGSAKFFKGVGRQLSANSRYYDFGELDFTFHSFHFLTPCVYVNFK
jgi:hypothetical protein